MIKSRIFDLSLFILSVGLAYIFRNEVRLDHNYFIALGIYWLFSSAYFRLRLVIRRGNSNIDYGISYTSSFGVFAGPLGTLLFQIIYRFTVLIYKKKTRTADPGEFLDTFYNIGSFSLSGTASYLMYKQMTPLAGQLPFGYLLLFCLIACAEIVLTWMFLVITFRLSGDIKGWRDAISMLLRDRNAFDFMKILLTNALLLHLLQMLHWEMLLALFILNYVVSLSFYSKAQKEMYKFERDQFEQMAYRDFLTGSYNRAYLDKMMQELQASGERIGVVVADIDRFKSFNDSYNHAVGDRVIVHFADTLKGKLDSGDHLFRSGGEEFTIFLRGKTYEECYQQTQGMLRQIEESKVDAEFEDRSIRLRYSASFGLYYCGPDPSQSAWLQRGCVCADELLLKSKKLGRNRLSSLNEATVQLS